MIMPARAITCRRSVIAQATIDFTPMTLVARSPRFVFSSTIPSHWCPGQPEFSHVASAFMAALPQLEPYFIHNMREALPLLRDDALREQAQGFIAQEARHAQQHRHFNQLLAQRYPELPRFEQVIRARLAESKERHSLAFRLAYTSGYEAITYHLVCFLMEQRAVWLRDADPSVLALLAWHAAEEVEHKTVAYDVFRALAGGYGLRARGLFSAFVNTIRDSADDHALHARGRWPVRPAQLSAPAARHTHILVVQTHPALSGLPEAALFAFPGAGSTARARVACAPCAW